MSEGTIIKADPNKTLAQMQAEVAAFEANPVPPDAAASTVPPVSAVAPATPNGKTALPEPGQTPPAPEQAKTAQQPQETAEKVASEPPKAAEPVKDNKDWKSAYEGLQRSYNKAFVEKKAQEKTAEKPQVVEPTSGNGFGELTPETEQRFLADLEKAPAKTIVSLVREILGNEISPIRAKIEADEFEKRQTSQLAGLDRLAAEGHDWLKTEDGLRKMQSALEANPELWNSKDPYRAALGFIPDVPSKAGQRGQAQATGLTPILGAGSALPTVVSAPAVSKMAKLEALLQELTLANSRGQLEKAKELTKQMDEIERGY